MAMMCASCRPQNLTGSSRRNWMPIRPIAYSARYTIHRLPSGVSRPFNRHRTARQTMFQIIS